MEDTNLSGTAPYIDQPPLPIHENDKKKKQSFLDKNFKIIAIVALIFAILLLIYTVYRIVPVEVNQNGGGRGRHSHKGHHRHGRHMKGGSCGCSAGLSIN